MQRETSPIEQYHGQPRIEDHQGIFNEYAEYFKANQDEAKLIALNPFEDHSATREIQSLESVDMVRKAAMLAEPKTTYDEEFDLLPNSEKREQLYRELEQTAEISARLVHYAEDEITMLTHEEDDVLYKALCSVAFGTDDESVINSTFSQRLRRGIRMSIYNILAQRRQLKPYREQVMADPKGFAEKIYDKKFKHPMQYEEHPLTMILYLDDEDFMTYYFQKQSDEPSAFINGLITGRSNMPDDLKYRVMLLNRGRGDKYLEDNEKIQSTKEHELRHILFATIYQTVNFPEVPHDITSTAEAHAHLEMEERAYLEKARNEIIAYASEGKFTRNPRALGVDMWSASSSDVSYSMRDWFSPERTAVKETGELFGERRKSALQLIARYQWLVKQLYDNTDDAYKTEALLQNISITKMERLLRFADYDSKEEFEHDYQTSLQEKVDSLSGYAKWRHSAHVARWILPGIAHIGANVIQGRINELCKEITAYQPRQAIGSLCEILKISSLDPNTGLNIVEALSSIFLTYGDDITPEDLEVMKDALGFAEVHFVSKEYGKHTAFMAKSLVTLIGYSEQSSKTTS